MFLSSRLLQLRDKALCIFLHSGAQGYTFSTLVFTTIFHAPVLHELQYKFPVVRNVWNNVSSMSGATA